jgi:hypothetical protein
VSERRIREELVEPLRRTLGWLLALRDSRGAILCPEHKIEHTGKSAGAAVLAARLAQYDAPERRAAHLAAAIQQGRRLVANVYREGTSECHTFWPGRHDKFNSSNAVIDGGACSDALAELVETLGTALSDEDRKPFANASTLHARTYLRYAVLDKGVPAQRAWGLTGLAAAWRLSREPELEKAAIEAVGALEGVQNADGSFPYHPLEWGAPHAGAGDASSFYHSRIPAFALFALERLERDARDRLFSKSIYAALDFAEALQGPDGVKCGLVEAKPWYWGAEYEVASHVFDVFAFARAGELFREKRFTVAAVRAYRAWIAHLAPSGEPRSHLPAPGRGKSYQCPVFWACHAEWIARALPWLEASWDSVPLHERVGSGGGIDLRIRSYGAVDLVRVEDDAVVAWVRGSRPGYNVHHGSPHGTGLLRVVRKRDGASLLARERLAASQEGEWSGRAGSFNPARGWAACAQELRFSLWLSRNHARGGRWTSAFGAPFDVARRGGLQFASTEVSSSFALHAQTRIDGEGVSLSTELAHRGGQVVAGSRLERRFEVDGAGLVVEDRLLEPGGARGIAFRFPAAATERREEHGASHAASYRLA